MKATAMRTVTSTKKSKINDTATDTTLLTHVRELQIRLLVTAVVLVGAGVVAYLYYAEILDILRKPLNAPLYTSSVSGDFSFVMKICMVAGIAVSVPLIIYNFIMFVRPAFIEVFTRKRVVMMTVGSVLAAAGGMLFGYYFIIPGAIHFFSGFQVSGLKAMIQADGYLNFVVNVIVTFILMFQLPIIASLIDRIKPISPRAMWKGEKWALIGSVIISLVVPFAMDFTTQILIAAPIFILYNISFVVIVIQHAYVKKVQQKNDRIAARAERRTHAAATRQAKKVQRSQPVLASALAAPTTLAPYPGLSEVFELQSRLHKPVSAAAVKSIDQLKTGKPVLAHAVHTVPSTKPTITRQAATRHAFTDIAPQSPVKQHPVHKPTVATAAAKPHAHVTAPAVAHAQLTVHETPPAVIQTPAVQQIPRVSADIAPPVVNRAQPTAIIRSAGRLPTPPQRVGSPYRGMRIMSDVR